MKKVYLFKLKFNTPHGLRVGGPKEDINTLTPLQIDQYYIIPSSSWKGIFRRATEVLIANPNHFKGHENEDVVDDGSLDELLEAKGLENKNDENIKKERKRFIAMWNCPVERLYGSEYFASAVTFSDTLIDAEINERTHVVIERKTRRSKEKYLFKEQIVNVNNVKVNAIVRDRIEDWIKTLKFLSEVGTFIGGGKSRGIGYAILDWKESEYAEVDELTKKVVFKPLEEFKI